MANAAQLTGFHVSAQRSEASFLAKAWAQYKQYRLYRQTVDELSQLSRHDLADLGIHPSSIRSIAHEAVYGA